MNRGDTISLLTGEYPPQIGGVAGYTYHLAHALARQGFRVEVITRQLSATDSRPGISSAEQVTVADILPQGAFGLKACWYLLRHLSGRRYERVIFQYVPHLYGRAGLAPLVAFAPLLFRLTGTKEVCTMFHEVMTRESDTIKKRVQWFFHIMQALLLVLFSQKLITNNPVNANFLNGLAQTLRQKKCCKIIPVGSNIALTKATPEELARLKSSLNLAPDELLLMVFSPFTVGKDLESCLQVLARLPKTTLVCLGGSPNPARWAVLQTRAQSLGVACRLRLIPGPLTERQISHWLQTAEVYLHTAHAGASSRSTTLAAALQHGLAVIAYEGAETSAIFKNGENILLVEPGDVCGIITHLKNLAQQPALLQNLRASAVDLYNSVASWETIVQSFCKALR
ncbi:MAG: glycosyltransferase family 4 protein [Chloroflexi bacterium]|nr:glycosyltransferase family 4 protein [Chloroflexota bacterium]